VEGAQLATDLAQQELGGVNLACPVVPAVALGQLKAVFGGEDLGELVHELSFEH
jgi:hypothetical protein